MAASDFDLVIGGTGTRLSCVIGVLRALENLGLRPRRVCGTSGGAIIATGLAHGLDSVQLEALAKATLPKRFLDPHLIPVVGAPGKGFNAGHELLKAFREFFPPNWMQCKIPLQIVTFNLSRGAHHVWSAADQFSDLPLLVRASMSLPLVFDMVEIAGEWHVDGGLGANFPLDIFGNGQGVIGVRPKAQDPSQVVTFKNHLDVAIACLNGLIESTSREHVEDALYARVIAVQSKHSGLDFGMDEKDVEDMIAEGMLETQSWLKNGGMISS